MPHYHYRPHNFFVFHSSASTAEMQTPPFYGYAKFNAFLRELRELVERYGGPLPPHNGNLFANLRELIRTIYCIPFYLGMDPTPLYDNPPQSAEVSTQTEVVHNRADYVMYTDDDGTVHTLRRPSPSEFLGGPTLPISNYGGDEVFSFVFSILSIQPRVSCATTCCTSSDSLSCSSSV